MTVKMVHAPREYAHRTDSPIEVTGLFRGNSFFKSPQFLNSTSGTSISTSYTVPTVTYPGMYIFVMFSCFGTDTTPTSFTYNGSTLTRIANSSNGSTRSVAFYSRANPATGSNTLASVGGSFTGYMAHVVVGYYVNQPTDFWSTTSGEWPAENLLPFGGYLLGYTSGGEDVYHDMFHGSVRFTDNSHHATYIPSSGLMPNHYAYLDPIGVAVATLCAVGSLKYDS